MLLHLAQRVEIVCSIRSVVVRACVVVGVVIDFGAGVPIHAHYAVQGE